MVRCRDVLHSSCPLAYPSNELGGELWVPVANELQREPKSREDVLDDESRCFFGHHALFAWDEYRCLSTVMIGYGEYRVVSL